MKANSRSIGPRRNSVFFKAEAAKHPASKQLWIQLAHDWIALSEAAISPPDQIDYLPRDQLEPFLVA